VTLSERVGGLLAPLAAVSPVEAAGAALGLVYVVLVIRQHRACWLAALASTALYLVVFWQARLYMQAVLQAYYVAVAVYGWRAWGAAADGEGLAVSRTPWRHQALAVAAVLAASIASARVLALDTGSADPLLDSLTTWASVWATWLVARKRIDNWAWWFGVDALLAWLCWRQQLFASMILYLSYVGLIVIGWRSWHRDWQGRSGARA
jgi:nicotinamide mononucleotide transporter